MIARAPKNSEVIISPKDHLAFPKEVVKVVAKLILPTQTRD